MMPLHGPCLLPEGLHAKSGARLRATSHCEGFRVRYGDFETAVVSVDTPPEWLPRFRLLERDVRRYAQHRLASAHGASDASLTHPDTTEIQAWSIRRQRAISCSREAKLHVEELAAQIGARPTEEQHSTEEHSPSRQLPRRYPGPGLKRENSAPSARRERLPSASANTSRSGRPSSKGAGFTTSTDSMGTLSLSLSMSCSRTSATASPGASLVFPDSRHKRPQTSTSTMSTSISEGCSPVQNQSLSQSQSPGLRARSAGQVRSTVARDGRAGSAPRIRPVR